MLRPCTLVLLIAIARAATAGELIVNGDAETGDLSGWTLDPMSVPNGDAIFGAMMMNVNGFLPCQGDWFFSFDAMSTGSTSGSGVTARMYQVHPIPDGTSTLRVRAALASDPAFGSCDPGRVVFTLLDQDGAAVDGGFDTDWILVFDWLLIDQLVSTAAAEATSFRIELLGRLDCGVFMDSFFDSVSVVADPCVGDTNSDQMVDVSDLLAVLADWGPCDQCPADFDGSGVVDVTDLLTVLGNWGPCP